MAHTADTQITRLRLDMLTVLLRKTAYSSLVYLTASVQVHDALAMQPRQTNWIQLTRVKAEKNLDDEVVQWTWVLNAQNEWSESALSTAGHRVGSRHVQRAEHWTHSHIILQSLTMLNHLFVVQWCCHYTNSWVEYGLTSHSNRYITETKTSQKYLRDKWAFLSRYLDCCRTPNLLNQSLVWY